MMISRFLTKTSGLARDKAVLDSGVHLLLGGRSEDVSRSALLDLGEQSRARLEALLHLHARVLLLEPVFPSSPKASMSEEAAEYGQRSSLLSYLHRRTHYCPNPATTREPH